MYSCHPIRHSRSTLTPLTSLPPPSWAPTPTETMTLAPTPHEQLQEAHTDPLETWKKSIHSLKAEIATLTKHLASLTSDETEAQDQLESLTYALGLTKSELERRKRSNNELSTAYQCGQSDEEPLKQLEVVQKLEGELLNAKRDSANMEYEVECLEFRLKRLQDDAGCHEPKSPILSQSPRISMRSPIGTSSPQVRQGRLIGDVDAVIRIFDGYKPCRVGVSAGGTLGIYSYNSPEPLLFLDERVTCDELTGDDFRALKDWLRSAEIVHGGCGGVLMGLAEGVKAGVQIMNEVDDGIEDV